jgi:hypothetical protein
VKAGPIFHNTANGLAQVGEGLDFTKDRRSFAPQYHQSPHQDRAEKDDSKTNQAKH